MQKHAIITIFLLIPAVAVFSQSIRFSLATDVSALRSFKKDQRYWALGQTVSGNFHFTSVNTAYIWVSYYTEGKFKNDLVATAKSAVTTPQERAYTNRSKMNFRHVSIGWKHYFKGGSDIEKGWSFYGYGGFGLMIGRVINSHSVTIDTADYVVPVLSGKANFKRLTFDLGLGYETPLGGDLYLYVEGRALVPASDYPSRYILINENAPFTAALNLGFRIYFNY